MKWIPHPHPSRINPIIKMNKELSDAWITIFKAFAFILLGFWLVVIGLDYIAMLMWT